MKKIIKNYKNRFYYLKNKILFIICVIIIFRIGNFIPIPGIKYVDNTFLINNNITKILNIFSGFKINHISMFSLGLIPYISASSVVQFFIFINSKFLKIKKYLKIDKNKIDKIINFTTFIFSIIQSFILYFKLKNFYYNNLFTNKNFLFILTFYMSLITGSLILMWLGNKITEKKIGNGISLIICSGILINFSNSFFLNKKLINLNFFKIICFFILLFLIIFCIFYIETSQRNILINYKNNQNKKRFYIIRDINLPLKINISGVTPVIFSSSIVLFITNMLSFSLKNINLNLIKNFIYYLKPGGFFYIILYINFIIFLNFYNSSLFFNSKEISDNLKKSGSFINGIRPGKNTEKYINKIILRLNNLSSIYIVLICLIPEIIMDFIKIPFYLAGTSILIIVLVIIETISQVQTSLISFEYNSVIKKSKIK